MSTNLQSYLDFATETAWEAGQLTLGYFQSGLRPDWKADDTPVTAADRAAEELIRQRIEERYPDHAIVGEEFGVDDADGASHRWFIDPIDGTRAFVRGVPLYAVLIGLEIEGRVEVGVANYPAMGEMLRAASGLGCWWNGRRAHVSETETLKEGLIAHADSTSFARWGRGEAWQRLQKAAGFRAGWSDAYGYLLVATGRAEAMFDPIMNAWDCGPFPVILREAGGFFGSWQGQETIHANEALGCSLAVKNEILHLINQ